MPCGARGMLRLFPMQVRLLAPLPIVSQGGLGKIPANTAIVHAIDVTRRVRRRVILVRICVGVVGLVGIALAPISLLASRIHLFAGTFADESARDRADNATDYGTDRPGQSARCRTCHGTARCPETGTDRMRARFAGDGIAIHVAGFLFLQLFFETRHDRTPCR